MVHVNKGNFTSQEKKENQGPDRASTLDKVLSQAAPEPKLSGQLGQPYPVGVVCCQGTSVCQERPPW